MVFLESVRGKASSFYLGRLLFCLLAKGVVGAVDGDDRHVASRSPDPDFSLSNVVRPAVSGVPLLRGVGGLGFGRPSFPFRGAMDRLAIPGPLHHVKNLVLVSPTVRASRGNVGVRIREWLRSALHTVVGIVHPMVQVIYVAIVNLLVDSYSVCLGLVLFRFVNGLRVLRRKGRLKNIAVVLVNFSRCLRVQGPPIVVYVDDGADRGFLRWFVHVVCVPTGTPVAVCVLKPANVCPALLVVNSFPTCVVCHVVVSRAAVWRFLLFRVSSSMVRECALPRDKFRPQVPRYCIREVDAVKRERRVVGKELPNMSTVVRARVVIVTRVVVGVRFKRCIRRNGNHVCLRFSPITFHHELLEQRPGPSVRPRFSPVGYNTRSRFVKVGVVADVVAWAVRPSYLVAE